jgi:ADP-ribose pyrophosphatase YjhB (NUDIX family)
MTDVGVKWLGWAREIQALAQTSLHYAENPFEKARAERLLEIAAIIVAEHSELSPMEGIIAFSAQPGYVTPKVDVRAVVFKGEDLLFVREALDGCWTLPGGWADVGETPRTAIEREVLEEAGLEVQATRLIGVYDANRIEDMLSLFHAYKLVFLCKLKAGDLSTSIETSEVGFFPVNELPKPFSEFRTTPRHIADALAARTDPAWQTVFD